MDKRTSKTKLKILLTLLLITFVLMLAFNFLITRPNNKNSFLSVASTNISKIKTKISDYNSKQIIYWEDKYGPLKNESFIIVIQVHDRINYLKQLIESLRYASGIEESLLIFSHDFFDDDINNLVQSVDFCKFTQIFYPYSLQTHPHIFPGKYIPKNSDGGYFGLYRQTKHHWWWKANMVFDKLKVTKNHRGLFIFLEEDNFMFEDFIYVTRRMMVASKKYPKCNLYTFGGKPPPYVDGADKALIIRWHPGLYNVGLAFDRSTWMEILRCSDAFCNYDDYNWDWSLWYVSRTCVNNQFYTIMPTFPRAFRIDECGIFHKSGCQNTNISAMEDMENFIDAAEIELYPDELKVILASDDDEIEIGINGGWGDVRDRILCKNITLN